ncbi:unnamed protein product, partial [Mesorhabditis belari]|uniref:Uncharacterized protein n=1 Tax=Mesorhabditis belari TaxID=2138241 RepID=A0AAF3JA89_9BILA
MNDSFDDSFNNPFSSFPKDEVIEEMEIQELPKRSSPKRSFYEKAADLTTEYEQVLEELRRVEVDAQQLRIGLELRRAMTGCRSERADERSGPISCKIQATWLNNGHLFLEETLKNTCGNSLLDWSLVTTMKTAGYRTTPHRARHTNEAHCVELGKLLSGEEFRANLCLPSTSTSLPMLVEGKLMRKFDLGHGDLCVYRISLDSRLITLWDLATPVDGRNESNLELLDREVNCTTMTLPAPFVNLFCGCPKDLNISHLLKSLISSKYREKILEEQREILLIFPFSNVEKHSVKISVNRPTRRDPFTLKIGCKDSRARTILVTDLQAALLLEWNSLTRHPRDSIVEIGNSETLSEEFERICRSYS